MSRLASGTQAGGQLSGTRKSTNGIGTATGIVGRRIEFQVVLHPILSALYPVDCILVILILMLDFG
jgi:hypothetical protein